MRILLLLLLPIGDTLFSTPAIHALRERYPDARITALVYPTNQGILANNCDVDDFLYWPTRERWPGFLGVLRLFVELRRRRFDLAVEFCSYILWVTKMSGIPKRVEMNLPKMWWVLPWAGIAWRQKHAVGHYADVVGRLGIPVRDWTLRMEPSDQEKARAQAWLDNYGVGPGELLLGIHPGGEGLWGRKRWGVGGFAEVADGLSPLAAEIAWLTKARVINATGQTTLGETAALAARCSLFIGNDSSPLHIAAASGTPVVGIYGVTDPRSYHPWLPHGREGVDYRIVRSPLSCACRFSIVGGRTIYSWAQCLACPALETITPEQVLQAAIELLTTGG